MNARPTYDLLTFEGLLALQDPTFLIDDIAPDGLSVIFGKPGAYKTFVALDSCLCVATGHDWHGHAVKRRAEHLHERRGSPRAEGSCPRVVARARPPRPLERATRDMGLLIDAVCRAPADSQLVVHHTERSGEHERGSTSLEAAADLRVKAEREGASPRVTLTCKKGKDIEEWSELTLHAEHLHGSRVLSLVTDPAAAAERSSRPRPHQPCVSPSESPNVRGRTVAQPRCGRSSRPSWS